MLNEQLIHACEELAQVITDNDRLAPIPEDFNLVAGWYEVDVSLLIAAWLEMSSKGFMR